MAFSAAFITTYVLPVLSTYPQTGRLLFVHFSGIAEQQIITVMEQFTVWVTIARSFGHISVIHSVFPFILCFVSNPPLNPPHFSLSSLPTSFLWEFRHLLLLLLLQIWNRTKSQPNVQLQTPKIYESTLSPETSTWGRAAPSPKIVIWDVSVVVQEIIDSAGFALYISVLHSVNFL